MEKEPITQASDSNDYEYHRQLVALSPACQALLAAGKKQTPQDDQPDQNTHIDI